MAYSLTWLPTELEAAGLKVAEVPGWLERGRAEMGPTKGVICHHTAGPATGNMPSLGIIRDGRPDLPGPLAQLGLGRDGTYYVVAAGRANHAGAGRWETLTDGNQNFVGIEAENTGNASDPWPLVQMDAYQRGVAAILKKIGAPVIMCCGHKEYALPPGRKIDPIFSMAEFRSGVAAIMGGANPPVLIPGVDARDRATLRRGAQDELVRLVQQKIGMSKPDGIYDATTEAAVRTFQTAHKLVPDGIVGPKTWTTLDTLP